MSFTYLLMIFALGILACVVLLLLWARRGAGQGYSTPKPASRPLFFLYCALAVVFLFLSLYSVLVGSRTLAWFLVSASIGVSTIYFASSNVPVHRRVAIVLVVCLAVIESSIPIIENRGVLINSDQWRDLRVTTYILDQGTFQNAPGLGTGYYSFIPLFNVLNAEISQIAGWSAMTTFIFLQFVLPLVFAVAIYSIVMKLTGQAPVSIAAVLLFMSTPRLADVQAVPSTVGLCLGFLLILLFVKENASSLRGIILLTGLLAFVINVFHPVGLIPISLLCVGTIVAKRFLIGRNLSAEVVSFTWKILGIVLLITLAYWTADSRVFNGVFNPILRLVHIFTNVTETHPSLYTPQYQSAGFELFSFAWALPVAFSAAYVLFVLMNRRGSALRNRDLSRNIVTVAAFAGLFLVFISLVSVVASPGGGLEKYLNMPAYALLLLPSSFVFGQFLLSRKKIPILIVVLLLSANLVIGSRSPDWAPFENPNFGAFRATATSFIEASEIVTFFPNGTRLYEDYDIPLAEAAPLRNVLFVTDRSYETTRSIVQMFEDNSFTSFDNRYENVVIVMKTDKIANQSLFNKYVDIIYDSGRHVVIMPL